MENKNLKMLEKKVESVEQTLIANVSDPDLCEKLKANLLEEAKHLKLENLEGVERTRAIVKPLQPLYDHSCEHVLNSSSKSVNTMGVEDYELPYNFYEQFSFLSSYSLVKNEYLIIFLCLTVAILLAVIIISASYFMTRQNPDAEKLSAYECGFEPYEDARHTFDIRFCVTAILFIVFDIEIMFVMPWCLSLSKMDMLGFWAMVDFIIELGVGFFYVWYVRAFDWD